MEKKNIKVVFVAGPFRAKTQMEIERHVRRAEELALAVWQLGHAAICPHTNSKNFQNEAPDDVWLDGYIQVLARCDAVITTDNWEDSQGALNEVSTANYLGIPIFHSLSDFEKWVNNG